MRKSLITSLLVLVIFGVPFAYGVTFNTEPYEDTLGDGYDFFACFNNAEMIPMPIPMDIEGVETRAGEDMTSGEDFIAIKVTFNPPPLPHQSYTVEVTFDSDNDPATGASEPACFYNGAGVDYDLGVEVTSGAISSTWVDSYEDGGWLRAGSLDVILGEGGVSITVPDEIMSNPINGVFSVHLIMDGALDSAPNTGEALIPVEFYYNPKPSVSIPDIEEGSPFTLDAGASYSNYGGIVSYEWDFDNDGVYDVISPDPIQEHVFPDNGVHIVPLRITDELGITSITFLEVIVHNVAPVELGFTSTGNQTMEDITFTGTATDHGDDELSYSWDFGDGETGEGPDATHKYSEPGKYTVTMTVSDGDGGLESYDATIDVIQPLTIAPIPEDRRKDVYVVGAAALILVGGAWYYSRVVPQPDPKEEEEEDEPKKPGDYCEEHPEVVEAENKACWNAQIDLDSAVGDVQDKYDENLPRWQSNTADITRLLTEWDTTVSLIKYWTGVEDDITEDAERVQAVAGLVTNAAGKAQTAFKEGGEEVMKEIGEDLAKDVGKSVLGEISSTVGQVLELEDWAVREIGLGIAKGLTGVDPEQNAVNLRQKSEQTMGGLCSWLRHSEAWNSGRRPPDTIGSCLKVIDGLQAQLSQVKQDFEDAVKEFRCVLCDVPEHITEEIEALSKNLEKWEKTFTKLKEEVEKRLEEAKELYKDKDLYESPYEYLDKADENIERADKALS